MENRNAPKIGRHFSSQTLPINHTRRSRLAEITGSASSDREIMVAEIDAAAEAIAGCYEELSPAAKSCTVKLSHALANLRQRMVTPNDGADLPRK